MRITLDTNQFLRALMRPPELATFIMSWQAQHFRVVCSAPLLEEYELVLKYPKISTLIYPELRRLFLTQLSHEMELVILPKIAPICRDPDDDKVIATAVFGHVDYLATTDEDLRATSVARLLDENGITLTTIDDFLAMLG
ncbi:MAG: putative toxin-antitoxin system toxin component, PIN family [Caldilineaceae bacterium]|nr:putative toxin-antitoxin system toxin component, PIN family [Caldilineaceae bacterium]MCB0142320.1 putative toxin-antitoxin system toxin component, PIN family [Caldilineaceae bacterium]